MDWPERLKLSQESLSRAERELVEFINKRPETASRMIQKDLAAAAGVSKPVVISCFRRLGFEDFRSFQESVESFFATQIDSLQASRSVRERVAAPDDLIAEAAAVDIRSLERFAKSLNPAVLKDIINHIASAEAVYLAGEGTGFYPAHYLYQRLRRYGIKTVIIDQDPRHVPDAMHPLGNKDVLMAFHYSDTDEWLRPLTALATQRGAWILIASATIHPEYVESSSCFVHVPRGELQFKNSMAVPMHFANLVLLAYEMLEREKAEFRLESLEKIRKSWNG